VTSLDHLSLYGRAKQLRPALVLGVALLVATPVLAAPRVDAGLASEVDAGRRPVVLVLLDVPRLTDASGATPAWSKAGRAAIRDVQAHVLEALEGTGWSARHRYATVPALTGVVTPRALLVLQGHASVRRVGPDARLRGGSAAALPYVGADAARATFDVSGAGVTVAVFDSGIARDHPDFAGRVLVGGSFLNEGEVGGDVDDDNGHGTNVAGVLASAGLVAHAGVAPGARLLVYKVLDQANAGWISDWTAAIDHASANFERWPELRVTNASLESDLTFRSCPCTDDVTWVEVAATAWTSLADRGVLNVACTGNDGKTDAVALPACLPGVLAVGATYLADTGREPDTGTYGQAWSDFSDCADAITSPDAPACFTNVSACLDLVAPGVHLTSDDLWGGALTWYTGTSQASPLVAGAAALLFEAAPDASPDVVAATLLSTGVRVPWAAHPAGSVPRLDVGAAVAAVRGAPTPADAADGDTTAPTDAELDADAEPGRAGSAGCSWRGVR